MLDRKTLITVAQQVFDKDKHHTLDGIESITTDAKKMLEAFLSYELCLVAFTSVAALIKELSK